MNIDSEPISLFHLSVNGLCLSNLTVLTLEGNNFGQGTDVAPSVPASLCEIPGIEITISADILCPGNCCILFE
jgi:hypothetical protein